MKNIFIPQDVFSSQEWILRYKVMSLLIMSFLIGILIFCFSVYRFSQGLYVLAFTEFAFSIFLLFAFILLKKNKNYYMVFAKIFFVFVYILLILIFLYTPQNATRFHWIPITLVLIFFLLDTKGGLFFLAIFLCFIFYLILTGYPYSVVEYITWITSLSALGLVMYFYERIKENEKLTFLKYTSELQAEVDKKTKHLAKNNQKLQLLNEELEERVQEEVTQRLEQEKMLLRQCRMANMGEMIDAIAHQWRQPLMNINAILMNLDILTEDKKNNREILESSVQDIASITSHMSQTIEDFRALYQVEKQKHFFLLKPLIEDVLALMKNNLQGIHIRIEESHTISIYSYKSEFTQVMITLLSNAVEAFNTRNISDKYITIDLYQTEEFTYINVKDNAGGIVDMDIDKIFDPYVTTKKQKGGTGLGLYITQIIIEHNMQGKITVSNTGEGASFLIEIPKKEYQKTHNDV